MSERGVAAVERALSILDCFTSGQDSISLKAIAERTGLYKSTILRLCASLESYGYVQRRSDGEFQLGPTLWRLGVLYRNRFNAAEHIRPVLKHLSEATGESASFYVRDGDTRICLIRHNSTQAIRHHLDEGTRLPLTTGAASHLILAYEDDAGANAEQIKRVGFAISIGERDPDTAAIAVPLLNSSGTFLGALVVSGLRRRFNARARDTAVELARKAADGLANDITL